MNALFRAGKDVPDVQYVSYSLGKYFHTKEEYYCSLSDFIEATKNANNVHDLVWPYDIRVVGESFWLDWCTHGEWVTHFHQQKPKFYKAMSHNDIMIHLC